MLAVPIAALASLIELVAIHSSTAMFQFEAYQLADTIYLVLGFPLTRIVFILAPAGLQGNQNWWGIPLLDVLLIYQWIIWLQTAVVIGRTFQYAWRRIEAPFQPQPISWPKRIVKADGRRFKMPPYRARRRPLEKVH